MKLKKAPFILFLIALSILAAGCISNFRESTYTMRFSINETGEPLEGSVLNNGNLLGYAQNGSFDTNLEKLRPGLIALNGTYGEEPFEFYFEFPMEYLNYSATNFSVRTDDLRSVLFNASALDIPALEHAIFDLVNEERKKSRIKPLKWNNRIAAVAKDYSRTLSIEGFHHKDTAGKDAGARLKENKIFYIVMAENLFMIEGLNGSTNIGETVVKGWLDSPGHRSPIMDRDELFSDSGVGIYCEKKTCYAVMVFAGLEQNKSVQLNPGYLTFLYLYDPSYPFDFDVPVSIDITSTEYVDIYLVSDRSQFDNLVNNREYKAILESKQTKKFSRTVVATKGQGIVLKVPSEGIAAEIKVYLRYS